jgi:hypothetical protein
MLEVLNKMGLTLSAILNLDGNFIKNMQKAAQQTSQMQAKTKSFGSTAKQAFGAVGILAAGYLGSALNSAAKAQDSTVRLQRLVENQGISWTKASGQVSNFTSGIMKMSTYSAGDAKAALINLTTKGVKFGDALKMQNTLMDLAAGGNMDLTSASNLLGQAYDGRYMQLERLGIVTKEQVKNGLTFAQVQAAINKRFGGAAGDELNTYDGRMKQLNNTMTSFKTSIGTYLLPYAQKLATFLDGMAQKLNALDPGTKKFIAGVLTVTAVLGTLIGGVSFVTRLFSILAPSIEGAGAMLAGLSLPIMAVIAVIALLAVAFSKNYDGIRSKTMQLINFLKPIIENGITNAFKTASNIVNGFAKNLNVLIPIAAGLAAGLTVYEIAQLGVNAAIKAGMIIQSLSRAWAEATTIIQLLQEGESVARVAQLALNAAMLENPIGVVCIAIGALIAIGVALYENWGTIKQRAVELWNGIKSAFTPLANFVKQAFTWGADLIDGLVNGIKSKIGAIGNAVKGVGSTIASFLHFSCPDVGPLATYESWMPDFMQGMAKGIKVNTHLVTDPVKKVALGIKTNMQGGINGDSSSTPQAKTKGKGHIIVNIPKLADTLTVRNDSDIDKIAYALTKKLQKVANGMA